MSQSDYEKPSVSIPVKLLRDIEDARGNTFRSTWLQEAARMRLEIERAADSAGVDTDELDDGWWRDFLYGSTRQHIREQREREQALEAD